MNLYRSGDYVGRYLWRPAVCDYLYVSDPKLDSKNDRCLELCIGPGAHNAYLTDREHLLGKCLDGLLQEASTQDLPADGKVARPDGLAQARAVQ